MPAFGMESLNLKYEAPSVPWRSGIPNPEPISFGESFPILENEPSSVFPEIEVRGDKVFCVRRLKGKGDEGPVRIDVFCLSSRSRVATKIFPKFDLEDQVFAFVSGDGKVVCLNTGNYAPIMWDVASDEVWTADAVVKDRSVRQTFDLEPGKVCFRCSDDGWGSEMVIYDLRERRVEKQFKAFTELESHHEMFVASFLKDGRAHMLSGLGDVCVEVHDLTKGPVDAEEVESSEDDEEGSDSSEDDEEEHETRIFKRKFGDTTDGIDLRPGIDYNLKTDAIMMPSRAIIWNGKNHLVSFNLTTHTIESRFHVEKPVVRMFKVDEARFLTTHRDGSICIWSSGCELMSRSVLPFFVADLFECDDGFVTFVTIDQKCTTPEKNLRNSEFSAHVQLWKIPLLRSTVSGCCCMLV